MKSKLNDIQKIEIVNKYQTGKYTAAQLGREYGVHGNSITGLLHRRHITVNNDRHILHRKYTIDDTYFDVIDTEDKAYFLGLLLADGTHNTQRKHVIITLQKRDRYILEKFKEVLSCNKPLYIRQLSKNNANHQDGYTLEICSARISKALFKLGCINNKSLILKFPKLDLIPKHLMSHLIRGYFDGDGCIYIKPNKDAQFSITSSISFCVALQKIIYQHTGIQLGIYVHKNKKTATVVVSGRKSSVTVMDWLYERSTIYLTRKYKKYVSICSGNT